ncbi:xylulokinase [Aureimonas pseudogalii]|uniref:Xylulose kinase n=1 Tax=Aureimonas pseudogalii TaxID=1744844 RepID=A0A7W6H5F1_9HYPH|nr:xylulokinase [Aureimonas pseudogalii]MBB3998903.1 xylulokinase [Aureimonas pseudogalii]
MGHYLGLDLGTSSLKALVIDENQTPLATATVPLTVERPHFGWSEQDPASWLTACDAVIAELRARHPGVVEAVVGIGLSGHMHGATILGADDAVLRPCILWNDTRSHEEAAELDDDEARAITGNIVFPGFTAPKLLWVARNEPQIFAQVRRVLLPKDYLRLWLTGEAVSEMSDAAGTSWLDIGARDWSPAMLERTGLTLDHMPQLVEGTEVSGTLRPEIAARWGLPSGVVVAGGGGDNAASACGVGVTRPGTGFLSLGTSGVLFTASAGYDPVPETALHTFCHAIPGLWHQMGVTLSAAGSIEWLSQLLKEKPGDLTAAVGDDLQAPGRLLFLPYLSGERTPHNDSAVRGAFVGLQADTTREEMTRAVMEGVAFSIRDCLDAAPDAAWVRQLIAVGAGSRSHLWLKMMASVLETPVALPAAGDFGAAFGAARLGLCAATGADPASVMTDPPVSARYEPETALVEAFAAAHHRYQAIYPALKEAARRH